MENKSISYMELFASKNANYEESVDSIVSDLYPDIREILGVFSTAYVSDVAIQNDRILISGEIKSEVSFLGESDSNEIENDNILKMNVTFNFARVIEIDAKNAQVFVNCSVNRTTCKIVNPRKISIICDINLDTKAFRQNEIISNQCSDLPYECEIITKNASIINGVNINDFTVSDNVNFKINATNECELFGIMPNIFVTDTKILKNKLMLRGNVEFSFGYIDENLMGTSNVSVPFSQILDINSSDDELENSLEICITDFNIENVSENEYYFNIKAKSLFLQMQELEIDCIDDVYSTTHSLDVLKEHIVLTSFDKKEMSNFSNVIDLEENIDIISFVTTNLHTEKTDNADFDVFANILVVYQGGGKTHSFQKDIPLQRGINSNNTDNIKTEILSNNQLRISYDLKQNKASNIEYDRILSIEETGCKNVENDCIILKHIDKKTPIWNVAKAYNSTVASIKNANEIEDNFVENQTIIIPR